MVIGGMIVGVLVLVLGIVFVERIVAKSRFRKYFGVFPKGDAALVKKAIQIALREISEALRMNNNEQGAKREEVNRAATSLVLHEIQKELHNLSKIYQSLIGCRYKMEKLAKRFGYEEVIKTAKNMPYAGRSDRLDKI